MEPFNKIAGVVLPMNRVNVAAEAIAGHFVDTREW